MFATTNVCDLFLEVEQPGIECNKRCRDISDGRPSFKDLVTLLLIIGLPLQLTSLNSDDILHHPVQLVQYISDPGAENVEIISDTLEILTEVEKTKQLRFIRYRHGYSN